MILKLILWSLVSLGGLGFILEGLKLGNTMPGWISKRWRDYFSERYILNRVALYTVAFLIPGGVLFYLGLTDDAKAESCETARDETQTDTLLNSNEEQTKIFQEGFDHLIDEKKELELDRKYASGGWRRLIMRGDSAYRIFDPEKLPSEWNWKNVKFEVHPLNVDVDQDSTTETRVLMVNNLIPPNGDTITVGVVFSGEPQPGNTFTTGSGMSPDNIKDYFDPSVLIPTFSLELFDRKNGIEFWVFGISEKLRGTCQLSESLLRRTHAAGFRYLYIIKNQFVFLKKEDQVKDYLNSLGPKLAVGDSIAGNVFSINEIYGEIDKFKQMYSGEFIVEFPFTGGQMIIPNPVCPQKH